MTMLKSPLNTSSGALSNPSPGSTVQMQAGRSYHEQNTSTNFPASNELSWTVDWTAPSGPNNENIVFYAAGVIGNGSGSSNDRVRLTSEATTLMGATTPPVMVSASLVSNISCAGEDDGSAIATTTDGQGPFEFLWDNGETTATAVNLTGGMHTVVVIDDLDNTDMASVFIAEPAPLNISLVGVTHPQCEGADDGSIEVVASGGTGTINYNWLIGQSGPIANSLGAGLYSVTATDQNNCQDNISQTLSNQFVLEVNIIEMSSPSCAQGNDGTIQVSVTGSTGTLQYLWSNGETTSRIEDLTANTYSVNIMDSNGCSVSDDFTILDPAPIVITLDSIRHISCFGADDGYAAISTSGGTGNLTNFWSIGSMDFIQENLKGNTSYSVVVFDENECSASLGFIIEEATPINSVIDTMSVVSCKGGNDGYIEVSAIGGKDTLLYTWTDGNTDTIRNDLSAGLDSVFISDIIGCTDTLIINIQENSIVLPNATATNETVSGANDGTAHANPTGGVAPYSFLWEDNSIQDSIINLAPGKYIVTVTDALNCTAEQTICVSSGACQLEIIPTVDSLSCFGANDGMISIIINNATPPVNILWSNGETTDTIRNLPAGLYDVNIEDAAGCETILTNINVGSPDTLVTIPLIIDAPECAGEGTGVISSSISGGTAPYSYNWSFGGNLDTLQNLTPGFYPYTVTDINQCKAQGIVTLSNNDTILPTVIAHDVTLFIDDLGNVPSFNEDDYDNGSFDNCGIVGFNQELTDYDCSDIGDHRIWVKVVDVNGNENTDTITVSILDTIAPILLCPESLVVNDCNPVDYPLPTYSDNCSDLTLELIDGLPPGSIFPIGETKVTYRVVDDSNNEIFCSFKVTVDVNLAFDFVASDPSCFGFSDGNLSLSISGGAPPYLTSLEPNNDPMFLPAGDYYITVSDATNCQAIDSFTLINPPVLVLSGTMVTPASNSHNFDGSIITEVSGGDGNYSYQWFLDGVLLDDTSVDLENIGIGTYQVIITDGSNCTYESLDIIVDSVVNTVDPEITKNLELFPNPATEYLNVNFESSNFELKTIAVYSNLGKELMNLDVDSRDNTLDFSNITQGVYFIKLVFDGQQTLIRKVIVL